MIVANVLVLRMIVARVIVLRMIVTGVVIVLRATAFRAVAAVVSVLAHEAAQVIGGRWLGAEIVQDAPAHVDGGRQRVLRQAVIVHGAVIEYLKPPFERLAVDRDGVGGLDPDLVATVYRRANRRRDAALAVRVPQMTGRIRLRESVPAGVQGRGESHQPIRLMISESHMCLSKSPVVGTDPQRG
jgi:hypothetical protein